MYFDCLLHLTFDDKKEDIFCHRRKMTKAHYFKSFFEQTNHRGNNYAEYDVDFPTTAEVGKYVIGYLEGGEVEKNRENVDLTKVIEFMLFLGVNMEKFLYCEISKIFSEESVNIGLLKNFMESLSSTNLSDEIKTNLERRFGEYLVKTGKKEVFHCKPCCFGKKEKRVIYLPAEPLIGNEIKGNVGGVTFELEADITEDYLGKIKLVCKTKKILDVKMRIFDPLKGVTICNVAERRFLDENEKPFQIKYIHFVNGKLDGKGYEFVVRY